MIAFIDDHRGAYGVEPICKVLPIAPSTYHEHIARRADPSRLPPRAKRDAGLRQDVRRVFEENLGVYGMRKVERITKRGQPATVAAVRAVTWSRAGVGRLRLTHYSHLRPAGCPRFVMRSSLRCRRPCRCAACARPGASWCRASHAATRPRRKASAPCCPPRGVWACHPGATVDEAPPASRPDGSVSSGPAQQGQGRAGR